MGWGGRSRLCVAEALGALVLLTLFFTMLTAVTNTTKSSIEEGRFTLAVG